MQQPGQSRENIMGAYLLSSRCKANVTPMHGWIRHPCPALAHHGGGVSPALTRATPAPSVCKGQALSRTPHPPATTQLSLSSLPQAYYLKGSRQQCYNQACLVVTTGDIRIMTADGTISSLGISSSPQRPPLPCSQGRVGTPRCRCRSALSWMMGVGACWPGGQADSSPAHAGER